MNNKGRIVVFISMMTAVMIVLITLVIQVVILSAAKSKNVIATRLSMSDIKACYNSNSGNFLCRKLFCHSCNLSGTYCRLQHGWLCHAGTIRCRYA